MKIIALLPMKEHSERIPKKNMRNFFGHPLYHVVMDSLLNSRYISKVAINTDSKIIAKDAIENFGDKVKIIERPEKLQGDFIPMNDIIAYDLSFLDGDHFFQTHATNPLITIQTIDKAIEYYFENLDKYDSIFSVTRIQTRLYWEDGRPINHNPNELLRTQDLPPVFEENSNFYIISKASFKNSGNKRIGLKPKMFVINKIEAIDIDEPEDWEIAEVLYKRRA